MKTAALDIGDVWTGTAISDQLGIVATPFKTVTTKELEAFLSSFIADKQIEVIVVGYPKTMRGTESDQTRKIVAHKEALAQMFPSVEWVFWDERMTSKQAQAIQSKKSKQDDKHKSHSVAAALILSGYLEAQRI